MAEEYSDAQVDEWLKFPIGIEEDEEEAKEEDEELTDAQIAEIAKIQPETLPPPKKKMKTDQDDEEFMKKAARDKEILLKSFGIDCGCFQLQFCQFLIEKGENLFNPKFHKYNASCPYRTKIDLSDYHLPLEAHLLQASYKGDLNEVKKLLEAGASLDTEDLYDERPLDLAISENHKELALFLFKKERVKQTFVDNALKENQLEITKDFLCSIH